MPELIDKKETIAKVFALSGFFVDRSDYEFELISAVIHRCCEEIDKQPAIDAEPVRKPEMSEADRKKCEEWCKDCEHIEMCKWYPFGGCDFRLLPKPEQPTIEPEVRHGRWNNNGTGSQIFPYLCTECNESCDYPFPYCPICGARMDGGADNA